MFLRDVRLKLLCHKLVELQRLGAVTVEPTTERMSQQLTVKATGQVPSVSCPHFLNREALY